MSFLQTSRDVIACGKFYLALPKLASIVSDKTLESEGLGTRLLFILQQNTHGVEVWERSRL